MEMFTFFCYTGIGYELFNKKNKEAIYMKKRRLIKIFILLVLFSTGSTYAKEKINDALDKEWYCNIVKGNALNNYFSFPSVEEGLGLKIEDYETSADYDDAVDYYNLENYRITLNFKSEKKANIGWTSLLYNDKYEESKHVEKNYNYSLDGKSGTFTRKGEIIPFALENDVLAIPSQNVVCYANLIEAQKHYNLYELNENFDKKRADKEGFVIDGSVLKKYIGTKRKLILPSTINEISDFDSDNVYYFSTLVVPSNVLKIDDDAFQYLSTEELVLMDGVLEIGNEAFLDSDFVDIYLPATISKIGSNAFGSKLVEKPTFHVVSGSYADNYLKNNYSTTDINIEYDYEANASLVEDAKNYVDYTYKEIKSFINSNGFGIRDRVLYACNKKASKVVVPNEVERIATDAFSDYYNSKVKTVIIPSSVKTVEYGSFSFTSAKTIIFDKGVEKLESEAFADAYLKDIYLPSTITKVGKSLFETEEGLEGTTFHVEKDSVIAKYLEDNPPLGDYKIVYDYDKAASLIEDAKGSLNMKIIIIAGVVIVILVIVILLSSLKKGKKDEKLEELKENNHKRRFRSLNKNIVSSEEKYSEPEIITSSQINNFENDEEVSETPKQEGLPDIVQNDMVNEEIPLSDVAQDNIENEVPINNVVQSNIENAGAPLVDVVQNNTEVSAEVLPQENSNVVENAIDVTEESGEEINPLENYNNMMESINNIENEDILPQESLETEEEKIEFSNDEPVIHDTNVKEDDEVI